MRLCSRLAGRAALRRGASRPIGDPGAVTVEIGPGVAQMAHRLGEGAITVDLTLQFCGDLALKQAVACAGSADETAGFLRSRASGLDVYWRQRILVDGPRAAYVTALVVPRRIVVLADGYQLSAEAAYAEDP